MKLKSKTSRQENCTKTGSALVIAMAFTAILAAIAVPGYIRLSSHTLKQTTHNYYDLAAINLAESGIESAVSAIMQSTRSGYNWQNWTVSGANASLQMDQVSYNGDVVGTTNILIYNYQSDAPEVVSKATIDLPNSPLIEKYMYARISASSTQGLFAYGVLAKEFILSSGGSAFDSWVSDPDNDPSTPFVPYSRAARRDKVGIATTGTQNNAIYLGSSDVYGFAAVGSGSYLGLGMSWGGQVGPRANNEWHSDDTSSLWNKRVDGQLRPGWLVSTNTGALTTGFTAEFENQSVPDDLVPTDHRLDYKLPYHYTDRDAEIYNAYVDEETLGAPNTISVLELNELEIKANSVLHIQGDVTIVLDTPGVTSLKVIASGSIELAPDATLTIYTSGDIEISGAGFLNESAPQQLQIWGIGEQDQAFNLAGSGSLTGLIYAPNASITVPGGTDIYGSLVCKNATFSGSGSFHYDESLANYTGGSSSGGVTKVDYVEELIGPDRNTYVADLSF